MGTHHIVTRCSLIILYLTASVQSASAFVCRSNNAPKPCPKSSPSKLLHCSTSCKAQQPQIVFFPFNEKKNAIKSSAIVAASLATSASLQPLAVFAEDVTNGNVEYAELPPPYIPVFFALLCLGGVGALTFSLGDIIAEGKRIFVHT
mmetsp:Transcript_8493/g.18695  ORF Transcript_8493/g.18695 Transcript_8493/m.18695 type:complete len:147 (-) Transcript_8493:721-1161(-)